MTVGCGGKEGPILQEGEVCQREGTHLKKQEGEVCHLEDVDEVLELEVTSLYMVSGDLNLLRIEAGVNTTEGVVVEEGAGVRLPLQVEPKITGEANHQPSSSLCSTL